MADSDYDQDAIHSDPSSEEFRAGRAERDRYFDYFYDLYDGMHQSINDNCLLILDQDNYDDFLGFCLENMNHERVEADMDTEEYQIEKQNRRN